jgi:predicted small metal-binding protein
MENLDSETEDQVPATDHEERVFEEEVVVLDYNQFTKCRFEGCQLVFNGEGPFGFEECEFTECDWQFAGSAAVTLHFLHMMHAHGGVLKEIADDMIDQIRGGDDQ